MLKIGWSDHGGKGHAATALTRIIERLAQRREVREASRQGVERGSGACGSEVGYDRVVPVEQAFTLVLKCRPKGTAEIPANLRAGL